MNKHHFNYMLEDTLLGIKRNIGSVIASVTLSFIALILIGQVLLIRAFVEDAIQYVESQLSMKVYVEDGLAQEIAAILEGKAYTSEVEIETGKQMIENLSFFFVGKEHLLDAFTDVSGLDAVKFQITDKSQMQTIAENLEMVKGIEKVVYPQQMAEILGDWISKIETFGIFTIIVFVILAFVMVYITFHLAMYQRKKELKVKMFLGIHPNLLRMQFLLEGCIIGIFGAVLAVSTTILIFYSFFLQIENIIPYIGHFTPADLITIIIIQVLVAIGISMGASFISTRKLINHA